MPIRRWERIARSRPLNHPSVSTRRGLTDTPTELVVEPFDDLRFATMTQMNKPGSRIKWRIVSSAVLAAMAVARVSEAGQAPAMLAISSPSDGAIVRPGQ